MEILMLILFIVTTCGVIYYDINECRKEETSQSNEEDFTQVSIYDKEEAEEILYAKSESVEFEEDDTVLHV